MSGCLPSQLLFVRAKPYNTGLRRSELKERKIWEGAAQVSRRALSRFEIHTAGATPENGGGRIRNIIKR